MSLYEQLQEKLQGQQYSNYFIVCCPFHNESHPSFFVYEDSFHCKSCNKHGSLEYLSKFLGLHGVKSSKKQNVVLPRWQEWQDKWGDLESIAKHANKSLKNFPQWLFYFRERKIEQFVEQGMLGYCDGWILFPVFDSKRKVVSIVVRSSKKNSGTRYVTHSTIDGKQYLYVPNYDRVKNSDYVILCYGIIDAWAFEDIGLPVVTGCTGQFSSPELLKELNKKVYIIPDLWEERNAHKLANSLGWKAKTLRLPFPGECKDSDDVRMKHGKDFLLNMVMEKIHE